MAAERTLSERELNRALLARQLLLERGKTSLPRALERIGGLQAQYAPSMYIGLWSRVEGFDREQLTGALERRRVVQGTLMRMTIHLVSKRDYWPYAVAVRQARREAWLKTRAPTEREISAAARRVRRALGNGSMTSAELDSALGAREGPIAVWRNGVGLWVDLVRVPPSGTWDRRRADIYGAAEEWVGPENVGEADGLAHLVRRYLSGFGPATRKDVADYCGVGLAAVDAALKGMKLRRFRAVDDTELVDLPRAPLPDPETPVPVRFLPTWDASLLAHARRTGILPEVHRPKVFNIKTPQSVSTFLVDGVVAGTWKYERGRVKTEPFGRLDRSTRRELEREAEGLAALHAEHPR
jgi:Winged helix DNA-binding domain